MEVNILKRNSKSKMTKWRLRLNFIKRLQELKEGVISKNFVTERKTLPNSAQLYHTYFSEAQWSRYANEYKILLFIHRKISFQHLGTHISPIASSNLLLHFIQVKNTHCSFDGMFLTFRVTNLFRCKCFVCFVWLFFLIGFIYLTLRLNRLNES